MDKPQIALAIMVENGGFGAAAAAPLARKILDYYLVQSRIPEDKREGASSKEAGAKPASGKAPAKTAVKKPAARTDGKNGQKGDKR